MNSVKSFIKIPLPALVAGGILSLFFLLSCKQQPIFYEISLELEPVAPKINGAATNIVIFDGKMYVAGEGFHQYAWDEITGQALWDTPSAPPHPPGGGRIRSLAATENYLYAVTGELGGSVLYRKPKGSSPWKKVVNNTQYPFLQSIFGDGTQLFVGAQENGGNHGFALLYDNNGALSLIKGGTQLLKGAVWDGTNHFLAVSGGRDGAEKGIYKVPTDMSAAEPIDESQNWDIEGLIQIDSRIVAVSRNGVVYAKESGADAFTEKVKGGLYFTGALTLCQLNDGGTLHTLLLLGVQGGSGAGGYREILLSGSPENWKIRNPGESQPSSVSSAARYHSSIANHPVNYIFQAPREIDPEQTLFASTQKSGLWSYRKRNGEWQWNGES